MHTNGVRKRRGCPGSYLQKRVPQPPVSSLLCSLLRVEWRPVPGALVASSAGGHSIYVWIFPVFGNLLPVREDLLDDSLLELKPAFIELLPTDVRPALRINRVQISSISYTTALQIFPHSHQATSPPTGLAPHTFSPG